MKTVKTMVCVAVALLLGGCATVRMSSAGSLAGIDVNGAQGRADRVIQVANEGYYLFQTFPLVAGDVRWDAQSKSIKGGISFFSNQLKNDRMLAALTRYADSRNCDLIGVVVNDRNTCPVGFFGLMDLFNTFIGYQAVSYSAVLRPRN